MILIYLASPYSHPDPITRDQRFQLVCKKAVDMIVDGYLVYSPIISCHPLAAGWGLDPGWEFWQALDEKMISVCDEVHIYCIPGWRESKGIAAEIGIATRLEKPIVYHQV